MQLSAKKSEWALFSMTSLMSFAANLPLGSLSNFIDQRTLLLTLGASILIALFHYVQLLLSTVMCLSTIGANLPPEVASTVGVQPPILTLTLAVIVSIALLNRVYKLLPSEIPFSNDIRLEMDDLQLGLLAAISRGDQVTILRLLETKMEINFFREGTAPILLAAEKGYSDITQILIRHGADFRIRNAAGQSPIDIALAKRFIRSAEILHLASKEHPEALITQPSR
jgi:hypothetical protein